MDSFTSWHPGICLTALPPDMPFFDNLCVCSRWPSGLDGVALFCYSVTTCSSQVQNLDGPCITVPLSCSHSEATKVKSHGDIAVSRVQACSVAAAATSCVVFFLSFTMTQLRPDGNPELSLTAGCSALPGTTWGQGTAECWGPVRGTWIVL